MVHLLTKFLSTKTRTTLPTSESTANMHATFLLTLETEGDTDLLGIAEEISHYIDDRFTVISCHPWAHPSKDSGATLSTLPVAPANKKT
jgi:hypothetical protein